MSQSSGLNAEGIVAQLGLTQVEMDLALQAVEQARTETVPLGDVLTSIENLVRRFDDPAGVPAGAIMDCLSEYRGLLETGIALRAFAAGMRFESARTAG